MPISDLSNVNFFEAGINGPNTKYILMFLAQRLGQGQIFMISPGTYRMRESVGEWAMAYGAGLEKGFV